MPSKGKGRSRSGSHDHQPAMGSSMAASPSVSMSYDELLDSYCRNSNPPPSATLRKIADALKICSDVAKAHSDKYDRGLRETSRRKNDLLRATHEQERAEREAEEDRKERLSQAKAKPEPSDETRPLAVGARSLAPQDGTEAQGPATLEEDPEAIEARPASPAQSHSSVSSHQPPPAPAVPQFQTFGPDPSAFNDPTVYHLRDVYEGMGEDEKRAILGVTHHPSSDLHDLTCGTPPDMNFSNAKPANQISATTFLATIEPYLRALVPEDTSFLEERGDRITPFTTPKRGLRSYKEVWAEEDGTELSERERMSSNVAHAPGNVDQTNDELGESVDVSAGPMIARLLASLRPERRVTGDGANGSMTNGEGGVNGASADREPTSEPQNQEDSSSRNLPPASQFSEAAQSGWKNSAPRLDSSAADERLKQELRYIGFFPDDVEAQYDAHFDDEVASRLRYLQEELERVSILNGARKARVLEMAEERMAKQEWSTIADDLDSQLNQAYLKRHRNIGKGKKQLKRPGGPGGGSHTAAPAAGVSKPSVGEPIRSLMERRREWNSIIGPVVDFGRTSVPEDTIFDEESMKRLTLREKELWVEAQEQ